MVWIEFVPVAVYMSKATLMKRMMEWKAIPWRKLERKVFKLHSSHIQSPPSGRFQGNAKTSKDSSLFMVR
jgi:hypothetical protein